MRGSLLKPFAQALDLSGILYGVTWNLRDRSVKLLAAHDRKHPLHGVALKDRFGADEDIVFRQQPHEVEIELARAAFHAEARIGHPARDIRSHGSVCELETLVAVDARLIQLPLLDELIEQQARPGIRVAVDKAHRGIEEPLEGVDAQWVAALHHQAHLTRY